MRTMDFPAILTGGGSLAGVVSLVDDGGVEKVTAKRKVEMFRRPLLEGYRFERWKAVNREGNSRD